MLLNADGHTFRNAHIIYTATPAKFSSTDDDNIKSRWKWIQKKKEKENNNNIKGFKWVFRIKPFELQIRLQAVAGDCI